MKASENARQLQKIRDELQQRAKELQNQLKASQEQLTQIYGKIMITIYCLGHHTKLMALIIRGVVLHVLIAFVLYCPVLGLFFRYLTWCKP